MGIVRQPRKNGTVIILGAGASYGSTVQDAPPLMKNFIKVGRKKLPKKYNKLWSFLQGIGFSLDALDKGEPNLEELYSRLHIISLGLWHAREEEFIAELGGENWVAPPVSFLESFIIESTEKPSLNSLKTTCKWHDSLVKVLCPGDSIISFNYDLIVDTSISKASYWSELGGYGFHCYKLLEDHEEKEFGQKPSDILLLKPHGSLNWYSYKPTKLRSYTQKDTDAPEIKIKSFHERLFKLDADSISRIGIKMLNDLDKAAHSGFLSADQQSFYEKLISATPESERWKLPSIGELEKMDTFIIPPTLYKFGSSGFPEELALVWQKMKQALLTAKRILSIGYSFPPADLHFDTLFRLATRDNNSRNLLLEIVDPSLETFKRIKDTYSNLNVTHVARTLEEYVQTRL